MVGCGESEQEIIEALDDLRTVGCDIVTFGQYIAPSPKHFPIVEYVHPDKFAYDQQIAEQKGFLYVASGPLVRSSYRAGEFFMQGVIRGKSNS
jgi:lipoic acid synthetase